MLETFSPEEAPSFARASSTFQKDETCKSLKFFVGDDEEEVLEATRSYWKEHLQIIDYDTNWSLEGEKWVGVVVENV